MTAPQVHPAVTHYQNATRHVQEAWRRQEWRDETPDEFFENVALIEAVLSVAQYLAAILITAHSDQAARIVLHNRGLAPPKSRRKP